MKKYILIPACLLAMLCLLTACRPETPPGGDDPNSTVTIQTKSGWQEQNGQRWYLDEAGQRLTGWQTLDGSRYYFSSDGILLTGWLQLDGKCYYLGTDGTLCTGLTEVDGRNYLLSSDGALQSGGWTDQGDSRYYLNADGSVYIGWLELDGARYYLKEDGTMARGKCEIDGTAHYFTSTGAYILLVNPWNPMPEDYEMDLVELGTGIAVSGMKVDRSCYDSLVQMIQDCKKAGYEVCVLSSYRSVDYQTGLFNKKVNYYLGLGYSAAEAQAKAATIVAVPGTSEHHSGLAVDIIDTQLWSLVEEQEDLEGQKWLMENCWRYGFILRYPKDKIDITGIIYEPWHYRYVGREMALAIRDSGLCLEEYLETLQ